jgi:hypothetical protein
LYRGDGAYVIVGFELAEVLLFTEKRKRDGHMVQIEWLAKPQTHDYDAASAYLALFMVHHEAVADGLKDQQVVEFKAKDIFRASGLPLLGRENYHVKKDIQKIEASKSLSPVLLVVDDRWSPRLIIADGYHRICAVYCYNEDISVKCQIVYLSQILDTAAE